MADRKRPDDDLTLGPGAKTTRPRTTTAPGQASTIAPGQLLGHTYRIEALLARGGMGEVYRARHAELNTEHAIKIILPELAGNTRIVDLFRREASVLRTIRHDAIVAYDGVFRDENGRLYLVMEFVDGPSLSKVFKQGALQPTQVRELRDRLADGLAAAHEKGVIHRDLSPDNVILPGGEVGKAKIIDFGISKMADPEAKTIVGDDFAGKYSYVSPEQVGLYGGKVDPRSDIYSLGLVLAAAAGGSALDMGSSPISVVEARRAVPKLDRVPAQLRRELTAMLEPDPADRPQSMRDLMQEPPRSDRRSESARRAERSAARTTSREPKPSSGGKLWVIASGAALAVVAVAVVGYLLLAPTPPQPLPQPPPQPQPTGDRIALLKQGAEAALQGFQCAQLSARVSQTGDIDLTGFVGTEADKQQIAAQLQGLPNVGRVNDLLAVMEWPLCEILGILHDDTSSRPNDPGSPQIDPGGRLGTYFYGDQLNAIITSRFPDEGYLYVDYVDGGQDLVQHLLPSTFRPDNAVHPGTRVAIGSLPNEKYTLGEPAGTELIVAIWTPVPLFSEKRPDGEEKEQARSYLAELRKQLRTLAAGGYENSLIGSYSVLTLNAR